MPPVYYGGIERVVNSLIQRFSELGHEVTLVANSESSCAAAREIIGWNGTQSQNKGDILKNTQQLWNVAKRVQPDIIHSFSRLLYLYPLMLSSKIPMVQTYQRAISPLSTSMAAKLAGKRLTFTACGAHMFKELPNQQKWQAIHNFTNTDFLQPDPNSDQEHLLFLGRIEAIKGTKEAIEVALATEQKLVIAGNIPQEHQNYFDTYVKPQLDHPLIEYVGPVNDEQKRFYFQRAKAFLFPIKWEEPFGIVMAESLACGTPVIGFKRGSVPEVIQHGQTGFICNNTDEMIKAVKEVNTIDRAVCRQSALDHFSVQVIAQKYLQLFERQIQ